MIVSESTPLNEMSISDREWYYFPDLYLAIKISKGKLNLTDSPIYIREAETSGLIKLIYGIKKTDQVQSLAPRVP